MLLLGVLLSPACAPVSRRVHAAAWQGVAATADVAANLATVQAQLSCAAEAGVELLLFPELYLHGYDAPAAQLRRLALTQEELHPVAAAAKASGACVIG